MPIKSLKSGNVPRNYSVADILGAKEQPNLRFTTDPFYLRALQRDMKCGRFIVPGKLTIAGVEHSLSFPARAVEFEGRHYVRGKIATPSKSTSLTPASRIVARSAFIRFRPAVVRNQICELKTPVHRHYSIRT